MTISIFGHRHPLMWVDQSESWFPAKHAHVRRHQTQHILCQQRLSYLRSTSNYFLVVAWFFYFFIEKADFFSKIQTFWRKRRPYLCVFFKKVLFADQSPLKRTQLVSLHPADRSSGWGPGPVEDIVVHSGPVVVDIVVEHGENSVGFYFSLLWWVSTPHRK